MLTRANIATLIFAVGKIVHSAGQSYFSAEQFGQYISKTTEPEGIDKTIIDGYILLVILCSAGVNIFINVPAFYRNITASSAQSSSQPENSPSITERLISTPLKSGAWTYTTMMAILGYFLTHQLSKLIASLSGTHDDDAIWKSAIVDISGILVAAIVFLKYASYDMKLCNNNADRIAHSITHRDIPINKAMVISAILSLLTLAIYPTQAFFFAKPALENTPGINRSNIAVDILTILSCVGTFITAFTWLPSIYDFFKPKETSVSSTDTDHLPDNLLFRSMDAAAYFTGLNDAVVQGMAAYMGAIAVAAAAFGTNPYSWWIIVPAALAMLNTTIIHTAFSVVPGVTATMNDVRRRFSGRHEPDPERGLFGPRLFQSAAANDEAVTPLLADDRTNISFAPH